MQRSVHLFACLSVLVAGVSIESPAEDARATKENNTCCGEREPQSGKVGLAGTECLQSLIYADESINCWLSDHYSGNECTGTPTDDYVWTLPGYSAPQYCNGSPGCIAVMARSHATCPLLQRPLPRDKSYIDILNTVVHYPGLPADRTWNPQDALKDLGELRTTFVKVLNADGKYFPVRLTCGICEMEKIRFPAGAFPQRPRIVNRKLLIGFETEMAQADVEKLDEAFPVPWERYQDCPTAFLLNHRNSAYHVTTTAANPVKYSEKSEAPKVIKPAPKNVEKK